MFLKDIEKVEELHKTYKFKGPLLEPGGLPNPSIADYEISIRKAYRFTHPLGDKLRTITWPHEDQHDRYAQIQRPWQFIDKSYRIENPEMGGCPIEELPELYDEPTFRTIICTSVFEHVENPFTCIKAIYEVTAPGGYFFNSVPFIFPFHDAVDNWRFSPGALKVLGDSVGFDTAETQFHIDYTSQHGIGDYHNADHHQAVKACYALYRKPE